MLFASVLSRLSFFLTKGPFCLFCRAYHRCSLGPNRERTDQIAPGLLPRTFFRRPQWSHAEVLLWLGLLKHQIQVQWMQRPMG